MKKYILKLFIVSAFANGETDRICLLKCSGYLLDRRKMLYFLYDDFSGERTVEMNLKEKDFDLTFQMGKGENITTVLNDIKLIYILSGSMDVSVGTENFNAGAGDFFLLNVGQSFGWKSREDCLYACLKIRYGLFTENLGMPYLYFICSTVRGDMNADIYQRVFQVLSQLVREYTAAPGTPGFRRETLWYSLMDILVRHCLFHRPESIENIEISQRMILVMQYVCANYMKNLSQDEAAKTMYLSSSAFSRWFKKQCGVNYGDFVTRVRLTHSVEDLIFTNKSMTDIALDNGFSNASVFTKVFRKHYGQTPTDYRKGHTSVQEVGNDLIARVKSSPEFLKIRSRTAVQKVRVVQADTDQGTVWEDCWNQGINAGDAADLLSARIQSQILTLKENLGLKYVRISNIFSSRLRLRKEHSVGPMNFDGIDGVMDFIISNGMHPFIDLCDREHVVFLAMNEFLYKEQAEGTFLTADELFQVLTDMFRHFVGRYGVREVSSWLIECWYDDRSRRVVGLDENYGVIFREICSRLKEAAPGIRVGGCGLELGISEQHFREIAADMVESGGIPDFITMYIYPYAGLRSQISDFDYTVEKLRLCRNILAQYHLEDLDIYVTEWNLSVSSRNYYNDSCAKASMLLRHVSSSAGCGRMFMYSVVSDLSSNYYDSSKLLFGAPGLMSKDGLYKPVYYALWFLRQLSGKLLACGPEHMITVSASGVYQILLFCPKALNYKYFLRKEYDIKPSDLEGMFEDNAQIVLNMEINHVPETDYYMKCYILDQTHGSLLDQWMSMGLPEGLNGKDIEYLKGVTQPGLIFRKISAAQGRLLLKETMELHQIKLIQIYPS
ncbi:beta-xylosidase/AraC-like DNA-binding protein [Catenibacillus scindens]|uniref:Beta-xylosidase/AraC-like DNA-binding protein n=1 Tax=Catenibacillus scindens TaxID=673271 RepID=A0A7W8M742_9FIRM|nr:helix-turn-helix domain-containing protein [Catenibacillus scindens]MBB5266051.1 beta-xylosidase/AraC-like DNA-binding protein [Catenibacillus scindens]